MKRIFCSISNINTQNKINTFYDLGVLWIEFHKEKIKMSTYTKYMYLLQKHIYPVMGSLKLKMLNSAVVDQTLFTIYHDRPDASLSWSTMKTILFLVKAILNYGNKLHYINNIDVNFGISMKKSNKIVVISPEEQEILIRHTLSHFSDSTLGTSIALFTGTRLGEICALQRKDIDFCNGILHVTKTVQRLKCEDASGDGKSKLIVTLPKSYESYRDIPIPEILIEYMKIYGIPELDEHLYILGRRTYPYEPRTLQYGFSSILKKCRLPHYTFHTLRHTFATKCIRLGFDTKTLSEILGHSNVNFTMNQYVHSDIECKKSQMHLLDTFAPVISQNC